MVIWPLFFTMKTQVFVCKSKSNVVVARVVTEPEFVVTKEEILVALVTVSVAILSPALLRV